MAKLTRQEMVEIQAIAHLLRKRYPGVPWRFLVKRAYNQFKRQTSK